MGKIFCLMGKSSSGKDTIYKRIIEEQKLPLTSITTYTTRPIRQGETDGVEYHFVTEEELALFQEQGKVIELRKYDTVYGVWNYFTVDDGQFSETDKDYLTIGTLENYLKLRDYFGKDRVLPIYVFVEDGIRLQRALDRERTQEQPKYAEMCRRFLADEEDFSESKLHSAAIEKHFHNESLEKVIEEITTYMLSF